MLHSKTQVINNIIFGIEFGYPHCCIKYFNVRQVNGDLLSSFRSGITEDRKLTGSGFICCNDCNEKYSEEELINLINSNRLRLQDFPKQDNEELDINKVNNLDKNLLQNLIIDTISCVEDFIELDD